MKRESEKVLWRGNIEIEPITKKGGYHFFRCFNNIWQFWGLQWYCSDLIFDDEKDWYHYDADDNVQEDDADNFGGDNDDNNDDDNFDDDENGFSNTFLRSGSTMWSTTKLRKCSTTSTGYTFLFLH